MALLVALSSGCVRYRAKPISAQSTAADWEVRSLADVGLRGFVETNLGQRVESWPPAAWDLRLLTLAAFYHHPDLDVARAKWGVAQAGIVTASGRPNPKAGVGVNYVAPAGAGVNPWLLQPALDIPIETFGKRGYRVQQAKQVSEAARLEIAASAWTMRSRLRSALVGVLLAEQEVELLTVEERIRSELLSILETRVEIGDLPRQLARADERYDCSGPAPRFARNLPDDRHRRRADGNQNHFSG